MFAGCFNIRDLYKCGIIYTGACFYVLEGILSDESKHHHHRRHWYHQGGVYMWTRPYCQMEGACSEGNESRGKLYRFHIVHLIIQVNIGSFFLVFTRLNFISALFFDDFLMMTFLMRITGIYFVKDNQRSRINRLENYLHEKWEKQFWEKDSRRKN